MARSFLGLALALSMGARCLPGPPPPPDLPELITQMQQAAISCSDAERAFQSVLAAAAERMLDGQSPDDLIGTASAAYDLRTTACDARDDLEESVDDGFAALDDVEEMMETAGLLLRVRLGLALDVAADPAATSSPFPDVDLFHDDTLPGLLACVARDDVVCLKEQLHRVAPQLATLSATDAYRLGEAFPVVVQRTALVLTDELRDRLLRAVGPLALLVCDGSKYANTQGNCLAFLSLHRDLLSTGTAAESPLTREACLFDVGSGALRCFATDDSSGCLTSASLLESFANVNGALGVGSCAYVQMASSCVDGVGPVCLSDACSVEGESATAGSLSARFATVSATTLDDEQRADVASACESGVGVGPGGANGGGLGSVQAFPGNFCQQRMYASLFHQDDLVTRCVDAHLEQQRERIGLLMNPLSALDRGQGCSGNPVADGGGLPSFDETWGRWGSAGFRCDVFDSCQGILSDYFASDEWTAFKEEYTRFFEAASGVEISAEDWAAAEAEAAKGRETTTKCGEAAACTKNTDGTTKGIRIYYNRSRTQGGEAGVRETGGHEAAHAAGASATWAQRENDGKSNDYFIARDHMVLCKQGEADACTTYETQKAALSEEEQKELDEAEARVDAEKAASESDGTTMPACGPTDAVCMDTCSPSALAAQRTFAACTLVQEPQDSVSPLDPYIQPVPDDTGSAGAFDLGACITATSLAHREQADACSEYSCPEGSDPQPCANGQGCCCGRLRVGAVMPPTESCADVVLCQSPTDSTFYAGAANASGLCGCESPAHPALPGKDPGRVFLEDLEDGTWGPPAASP